MNWAQSFGWATVHVCAAAVLAAPATVIALRRGVRAGALAAVATAAGLGLLGWLAAILYASLTADNRFAAGFALNILVIWMGLFLTPTLMVGLAYAFAVRRFSHRPSSDDGSRPA